MTHSSERPLILISNDDGIEAAGILSLAAALDSVADLIIAAPLQEMSAVGHAITMRDPVRARPWPFRGPSGQLTAYADSGTPADCVKLALDKLVPRTPDLVVSGINHGPNTAVNVIYSGTVSAATEAAILGIPAIAFSYCRWGSGDFEASGRVARDIVETVLGRALPPGILLNVNIPDIPFDQIKGSMITRQAQARWEEQFAERFDPFDRPYYWLSGTFVNMDTGTNTDLWAVDNGWVSITPIQHDLTAYRAMEELQDWTWKPLSGS
ncbi:MAG: 5'/3'-nucleotidase SurE [Bacteroidetes bacterium]|nr:5'/3'-nucleotidase SurE [Bacteroidota bacterium]